MQAPLDTWNGRGILHVDMDAFFAAVEQLDHPEYRGKPVIVGGSPDGRGVVSTASYEARRFGVRSAMPAAQAARLCPDAVWVWPRMSRYVELSRAIRDVFFDTTPHVEPISIDEAFLDVTPGADGRHPVAVARDIKDRIAELGLSASVGVATGKTVAKIASDHQKPDGLTVIRPGDEATFLAPLDIAVMSGIGAVTQRKLRGLGIATLGDLAALDDATVATVLGKHGPTLVSRSRGVDPREVHGRRGSKSVSHERTFRTDITDRDEAHGVVSRLSADVAARLRRHGLAGRTVAIKLRFSDFTTRTVQRTLPAPVCHEEPIRDVAVTLLDEAWVPGAGLRLLGVGVTGFEEAVAQLDLFDNEEPLADDRRRRLAESVDAVTERFGKGAVSFGSRGRVRPATPAYDPPDGSDGPDLPDPPGPTNSAEPDRPE